MAHGWDSYFHNLAPPSSDASTLRVPLDAEGNLSPHIDNLSGHHGFPSMVPSHEGPATNMNFGTNYYSDSGLNTSGAVYPNYYGNVPWQANQQQPVKDYNTPTFAPEEFPPPHHFATPDHSAFAAELKQEYGLLNSPFLEEYSDASNCSEADLGDLRPSCKFTNSHLVKSAYHADVAKHHSTSLWPSMSTGHVQSPMKGLCSGRTSGTPLAVQSRYLSNTETKQMLSGFVPNRMVTTENVQSRCLSKTETKQKLSDFGLDRTETNNVERLSLSKTETKVSDWEQDRTDATENVQSLSLSKTETKQKRSDIEQNRLETAENAQSPSLSKTETNQTLYHYEQDRTATAETARTSLGNDRFPNHSKNAMASESEIMSQDGIEHINACQTNTEQKNEDVEKKDGAVLQEKLMDGHLTGRENSDVVEGHPDGHQNSDVVEGHLDGHQNSSDVVMEEELTGHQKSSDDVTEEISSGHQKSSDDVTEEDSSDHQKSSEVIIEKDSKGHQKSSDVLMEEEKPSEDVVMEEGSNHLPKSSDVIMKDDSNGHQKSSDVVTEKDSNGHQESSEDVVEEEPSGHLKSSDVCRPQKKSQETTVVSSNSIPADVGDGEGKLIDAVKGNDKENEACVIEKNLAPSLTSTVSASIVSQDKDYVREKDEHNEAVQSVAEPLSHSQDATDTLKKDTALNSDIHSLESSNQDDKSRSQDNILSDPPRDKVCNSVDDGVTPKECSVKPVQPCLDLKDAITEPKPCLENDMRETSSLVDKENTTQQSPVASDQERSMQQNQVAVTQEKPAQKQNQEAVDQSKSPQQNPLAVDQERSKQQSPQPIDQVEPSQQNQVAMDQEEPTSLSQQAIDQVEPAEKKQVAVDQEEPTPLSQQAMGQLEPTLESQQAMDKEEATQEAMDKEATQESQQVMDQEATQESQQAMDQVEPTLESQEAMDKEEATQEAMDKEEATQEAMGKEEATQEAMDQEEPTQQQSQVAMELQSVGDNVPDGESPQEADGTSEQEQPGDLWYGEPLSSGDEETDTECGPLESDPLESSQTTTEPPTPLLKNSVQMRKRLQPVVVLDLLEPRDSVKQTYQCADCELTTESMDHLIEHHHRRHFNKKFHFCQTCDTYFNGQAQKHTCFTSEEATELPYDTPSPTTSKTTSSKKICRFCKKSFDNLKMYEYIRHMRIHTGKTPYKCRGCGWYFAQAGTLRKHVNMGRCMGPNAERSKPDTMNSAVKSTLKSKNLAAVNSKLKRSKRKDTVRVRECFVKLVDFRASKTCPGCCQRFPTLRQRQKHEYNVHRRKNGNKYNFQKCYSKEEKSISSSFSETNNLLENKTENEEKAGKYKCPLCSRNFMWSYNRARHLRDCVRDLTFGGKGKIGKRFGCPLCRETFSFAPNRKRHIDNFCLKEFVLKLARNIKVGHKSDKLPRMAKTNGNTIGHKSDKLPRMAKTNGNTRRQAQQKSEQLPLTSLEDESPHYQCKHCPAVFAHASGKYRHMKKHELYKMTGKLFRFKNTAGSYVYKPRKANTNKMEQAKDSDPDRRYRCNLCPASFFNASAKYKHMVKHRTGKLNISNRDSAPKQTKLNSEKKSVNPQRSSRKETGNSPSFTCHFCGKGFDNETSLARHRRSHTGDRPYRCLECGKRFLNRHHLSSHKKIHQRRIQCTTCKKILPTVEDLVEHRKGHTKKGKLKCPDCPMQFQFPVYLRRHMASHRKAPEKVQNEQKQAQCFLCNEVFPEAQSLESHLLIDHGEDEYFPCRGCKKTFSTKRELHLHRGKWTGSSKCPGMKGGGRAGGGMGESRKIVKCTYCPRVFKRENRFRNHLKGHKSNSLRSCPKCGQFYGSTKLTPHMKNCNGEQDQDPTSALSSSEHTVLPQHLTTHTGEKPYACMHCGKGYTYQHMCFQHEAFCDGVYREGHSVAKSRLRTELLRSSGVKDQGDGQYKCNICTKTFVKSRNLRHHILTHTEVNPYRCKICGSCFSRHDHMILHQSRCKGQRLRLQVCVPKISLDHVGQGWKKLEKSKMEEEEDQKFECSVCFKILSSQSNLARHFAMLHESEKSFMCKRCGASYTTEKSLKRHNTMVKCQRPRANVTKPQRGATSRLLQRIQDYPDKKKRYTCSFCPRSFSTVGQRLLHTRLHTGEKPYGCDRCGERFIRKDYLDRHSIKCRAAVSEMFSVLCDRCGGVFSEDKLEAHHRSCRTEPSKQKRNQKPAPQSPPKGFSCAYCGSRFLLFSQLQQHFLSTHRQDASKEPPMATAPLQQQLSNMVRIKEEPMDLEYGTELIGDANPLFEPDAGLDYEAEKPVACPQCDMRFVHVGALKGHLRTHSKTYPFACKTCNKGFWNKSLLRRHSTKCTKLRNKTASVTADMDLALAPVLVFNQGCQTTGTGVLQTNFKCKDEPDTDMVSENPEQRVLPARKKATRYQCSECDKSFTDGLLLISHLEDHGREEQEKKARRCNRCGRTFTSHSSLLKHITTMHGGDGVTAKRYCCPDCTKVFYSQSDLDIHRTSHDPNRPYNCKMCKQRFWNTRALNNHCIESHPDSLHACHFCDKSFSLKKSLARHYKDRHGGRRPDPDEPVSAAKEKRNAEKPYNSIEVSVTGESETDDENNVNVAADGDGDSDSDSNDSDTAPYFPCHVCSKTFPTFESLEDHQRFHLGEKPHECAECGKCFFQPNQLIAHQRMHKSEFQCQTCGRGFVSLFALRKHKHSHGKSRPYRCSKCSLFFPGAAQMAEHMAATHQEENFPCDICNRSFRSKSSRAEHRKSHKELKSNQPPPEKTKPLRATPAESPPEASQPERLSCGICFETFDGSVQVLEHGCKPSIDRPYSCPDCNKHFVFASHLRKHNAIHQQSQPYALECSRCRMNFSYRASFVSHLKKHAEEDISKGSISGTEEDEHFYKCPVCPRQFSTPNKLVDHFSGHSENTHECKTCKLTYASKSELEEHERCHMTAATQFECTECGNSYLGSDAFRQHRCSHHRKASTDAGPSNPSTQPAAAAQASGDESDVDVTGDDSYDCTLCSKQFTSKSSLLEHHNRQHGAECPFKCQYCGKGFALKKYLKEHERRERLKMAPQEKTVFKCSQCALTCHTARELTVHMRKHAEKGAGDYRCYMCYKSFNKMSLLRQHEESHVGQVVYECPDCDKAFAFPHLLEEHQQTHAGPSSSA